MIQKRKGSFALEAALAVPPLLLTLLFLISMCLSVQAEMRFKTALDRTAAEISLLPPIIFSLIDESNIKIPIADILNNSILAADPGADNTEPDPGSVIAKQLRSGILEVIQPDKLETLLNDAVLDLASSALLADIVEARINYWHQRLGIDNKLSLPQVWLDWNLKADQLFLEADYEIRTLLGKANRRAVAFIPIWRPADIESGSSDKNNGDESSIWQLDNFSRGQKLRQQFGGNLPASYPVIARFEQGEALAIKSMDLTKPTYAQPQAVELAVNEQFARLAAFAGTPKPFGSSEIWIKPGDITARRLLLIIPADAELSMYTNTFAGLSRKAESLGLNFELVAYGKAKLAEEQ
ncbi:MAG: hypothetical protein GX749_08860 [Ruminococcaceae bacterium]|nr:hypothetical protein [Oscillospiraceae bacterium]